MKTFFPEWNYLGKNVNICIEKYYKLWWISYHQLYRAWLQGGLLSNGGVILLQMYRLGRGVNKWRSVGFSLHHVVKGVVNSWEGFKKVLLLINGWCVWIMFFVIYISSYIQYSSSYIKVINHLHSNSIKASIFFNFFHKPELFRKCYFCIRKATPIILRWNTKKGEI